MQHTPAALAFRGWVIVSGTGIEPCGSQPDGFYAFIRGVDEPLHSWHKALALPLMGGLWRVGFGRAELQQEGQRELAQGSWCGTWILASWESAPVHLTQSRCPLAMNILCAWKNSSFSKLGFAKVSYANPGSGRGVNCSDPAYNAASRPQNPHFACQNSALSISLLFVPLLDLPRDQW